MFDGLVHYEGGGREAGGSSSSERVVNDSSTHQIRNQIDV